MVTDTAVHESDESVAQRDDDQDHEQQEGSAARGKPAWRWVRSLVRLPLRLAKVTVRGPMRRPVLALSVVAAVTVLLAATVFAGTVLRQRQAAATDARGAAMQAARTGVTTMLSYNHRSYDKDVAKAAELLTSEFRQRYQRLMKGTVRGTALKQRTATNARVARASVISTTPDTAETLLFVNQTTTGNALRGPQLTGSRVEVSLKREGNRWLISNLKPR